MINYESGYEMYYINEKIKSIFSRLRVIAVYITLVSVISTLAGCSNIKNSNGSLKSEDGRSYGGVIEGEMGKAVHTAFFDLTVDSAKKCGTYQFNDGLYIADSGQTYLEVVVTIANTYDKDLPMSITDFTLDFSENESETPIIGFGNTELAREEYMDNIFTLKKGESITKTILFTVADRAEYLLCYKEYYEDKFEGDSFEIKMVPEVLEPAVTTEATTEQVSEEASTEEGTGSLENESAGDNGDGLSQTATDEGATEGSSEDGSAPEEPTNDDTGIIEQ